jgi:Ni/Fe-hydrogenase subunit HybB-like protein
MKVINQWQRGVPLLDVPFTNRTFWMLASLASFGILLSVLRLFAGRLGFFSGMNDAFAWGIWKTFNVMTLTALGSGGFAVGIACWVFGKKEFHLVMRVALLTSLLFYATGLVAIMIDVGRPWNFWNILLPWRWNTNSALFEVSICMPLYAFVFLLFENLPPMLETAYAAGGEKTRFWIDHLEPLIIKVYPWMVAGAYLLPAMHQSSLGALLLLAGEKIHPLWQSPLLPAFYLIQAAICGFACVIFTLMTACLYWRRPLDMKVLGELGNWMSYTVLIFIGLRCVDILMRGKVADVYAGDFYSWVFHFENFMVLSPAMVLRVKQWRETPKVLYQAAIVTGLGGMLYRFVPTTIAYEPGSNFTYFPSLIELTITLGYIAIAVAAFSICVKVMPILPAPLNHWYRAIEIGKQKFPALKV